mmetsp:Transcript_21172/g.25175  ORF Transcript_21172/g.25175 Transcript_21172/m.25175 type:complete len:223 (-) Transcript_21172:356-1024(-)|eukprot:CAMPEP_0198262258 /NCGR_PEP_ID=MMETSP1447-20131203/10801_1 /TAXON_ID=420782 /ORGANISM="Chaetoceros dichaeta, Strain CCMP1751" /LENGTH=222 /DNA_ID=CAMNT_0043950437 /DNA_START=109 /DNA_END=777 /DNA_ORIENTATION=+
MIRSIHKTYRSFSNSTVASVIRNEVKDLSPLPFESHLSSATAKHRELNSSNLQRHESQGEDTDYVREDASPDTKNYDGTNLSKLRIGGRIRRTHIQKSSVENAKLSAVGGRIIREAPKESKLESQDGSVVAQMSATAKFRQRHRSRTGVFSSQENSHETKSKANPSSISILNTKPNAESEKTISENESDEEDTSKNRLPLSGVGIFLMGGGGALFYSGVIPI